MESMEDETSVKLTQDELLERGETLAAKMLHIEHLRDKKKADAKSTQALIDSELDDAQRLARVITGQEELRKQGELTFSETEASEALAKVGEAACTCESEDVAKVDCPVHGTLPARPEAEGPDEEGEGDDELAADPGDEPAGDVAPFPPAGGEAA